MPSIRTSTQSGALMKLQIFILPLSINIVFNFESCPGTTDKKEVASRFIVKVSTVFIFELSNSYIPDPLNKQSKRRISYVSGFSLASHVLSFR